MVEHNMTDKEQVDMIKKWWNDYGKLIAIAIAVGLVVAFGWRYWRAHKVNQVQKASSLYEQLVIADSQHNVKVAEQVTLTLMSKYKGTPYATLVAMRAARASVNAKDYKKALQQSEWVIKNSDNKSFRQIARLRAARILVFQKKTQAALTMLEKVDDKTFVPLINEVKGDIYTALKKPNEAKKAYKLAKSGLKAEGVSSPVLNMKLAQS